MTTTTRETDKGIIASLSFEAGEKLSSYTEFFDALMGSPSDTVAVDKADISEKFFELKTGMAGEVLQKVSNYRKRLIILGDFDKVESRSLRDFIYESNRTGKVLFAKTLDDAIPLLK